MFWSTRDARKRCVYTCRIREVKPESPKSGNVIIRDMTIIHDETHPDYVPLSQLDIPGINLFPEKCKLSNVSDIIDLSDESFLGRSLNSSDELLSSTMVDDVLLSNSSRSDRMLSNSYHGQPSEKAAEDELSKSWPNTRKRHQTDTGRSNVNLSLLSPQTLKLLNIKDPSKFTRSVVSPTPAKKARGEDFGNLIKIADRLNMAALNRGVRGKSEERSSPRLPSVDKRRRSKSVDRLTSPPRMLSPVNFGARSQSASSSRSGSVERTAGPFSPDVSAIAVTKESLGKASEAVTTVAKNVETVHSSSEEVSSSKQLIDNNDKNNKILQPISEEDSGGSAQPIIIEDSEMEEGKQPISDENSKSDESVQPVSESVSKGTEDIQPIGEENKEMSENVQPISEDETAGENETVIVLPEECHNLSEEECLMIAQMAMGEGQVSEGQGQVSEGQGQNDGLQPASEAMEVDSTEERGCHGDNINTADSCHDNSLQKREEESCQVGLLPLKVIAVNRGLWWWRSLLLICRARVAGFETQVSPLRF